MSAVSRQRVRQLAVGCALLGLLCSTSACAVDDYLLSLVTTFLPQILRFKLLGTSRDASLDAVLDAKTVLEEVDIAEWLMETGGKHSDVTLMEKAIAKRPRDWRFRAEAAALYLRMGDALSARQHLLEGKSAVPDRLEDQTRYASTVIGWLEPLKERLDADGYATVGQCQLLHDQLVHCHNWLWTLQGEPGQAPEARPIAAQRLTCSERVVD
jgi:hypothetical protein